MRIGRPAKKIIVETEMEIEFIFFAIKFEHNNLGEHNKLIQQNMTTYSFSKIGITDHNGTDASLYNKLKSVPRGQTTNLQKN